MVTKVKQDTEDYEQRFDERTYVLRVIHQTRAVVADWPQDVSLKPLIEQLRHEAERLAKREAK